MFIRVSPGWARLKPNILYAGFISSFPLCSTSSWPSFSVSTQYPSRRIDPSCIALLFINAFPSPALTCSKCSLTAQATISLSNPTHFVSPSRPRRMATNPLANVHGSVRGLYCLIFGVPNRRPDTEDNSLGPKRRKTSVRLLCLFFFLFRFLSGYSKQ